MKKAELLIGAVLALQTLPSALFSQADCASFKNCADIADSLDVPKKALPYYDRALEMWLPADGINDKALPLTRAGFIAKTDFI